MAVETRRLVAFNIQDSEGGIMKAYVRDDIECNIGCPPSSEPLTAEEWETLDFDIVEPPCEDWHTEEGFNMILKHPVTGRLIFVCSIDFNFTHYK